MVLVAVPATFAINTGGTYFSHQETLFIDLTDVDWFADGTSVKVYTYYGDSNNSDNWNVENNKNDSDIYNAACLANALVPEHVVDGIYKFIVTGDKVGAVKVLNVNADGASVRKSSGFMLATERAGKDCIKIKNDNGDAEWTGYKVQPADPGQNVFEAENAASITNNANLSTINAVFYDYYTDEEVSKGWRKNAWSTSHGDWEPYDQFNKKIQAASAGVQYPLYFGNFFDKNDGYKYTNFSNWVNNSARLGGYNRAVINLAGDAPGTFYEGTTMPYFNEGWLTSNGIGTVVHSQFPMRINEKNNDGIDYYTFDSAGATDNFWFSGYGNSVLTANYGSGTGYGAKDALWYYSNPQTPSGWGFFPFDDNRGDKEAIDFGFGMRVDIPFNISYDGQIENKNGKMVDQVFEFTGDDDVWVYVDNHLVLDLGGDHKMATGNINFHHMKGYSTSGTNNILNDAKEDTHVIDFSNWFDNKNPNELHTLTMFYMERGMSESNLKFEYNFVPVKGKLIVTETINTADVNEGLKDAVTTLSSFSFKPKEYDETGSQVNWGSKGLSYVIDNGREVRGTGADGFDLKSGSRGEVRNFFTIGNNIDIKQLHGDSVLTYDTEYTYKNNTTDTVIDKTDAPLEGKENTTQKGLLQDTNSDNPFAYAELQADFVNTPRVADVTISKFVTDVTTDMAPPDATFDGEFRATIELDLGDGFKKYDDLVTSQGTGADVTLKNGEDITIQGVPVGTKVRVTETNVDSTKYKDPVYRYDGSDDAVYSTVTENGANVMVENPRVDPEGEIALSIKKEFLLRSTDPTASSGQTNDVSIGMTANEFSFTLTGPDNETTIRQTKGNDREGNVFFDKIKFAVDRGQQAPANTILIDPNQVNEENTFRFKIKEADPSDDIIAETGELDVEVTVSYNPDTNKLDAETARDSSEYVMVNSLKDGSVTFRKTVLNEDGAVDATNTDEFSATVTVSYDGGRTFLGVPFYYINETGETKQLSTDESDSFTWSGIRHNSSLTIVGLPYGTKVRVAENSKTGYIIPAPITLTVGEQDNGQIAMNPEATLINQVKPANSTVITVNKTFTDAAKKAGINNDTEFEFTLTPVTDGAPMPENGKSTITLPKGANAVSFDKIKFDPRNNDAKGEQHYTYTVAETALDGNIITDTKAVTVQVDVVTNAAGELDVTQSFTKDGAAAQNVSFENDYRQGNVAVKKVLEDFDGDTLNKNVTFDVKADITYPNGTKTSKTITLDANGEAKNVFGSNEPAPYGTVVKFSEVDSKGLQCSIDTPEVTIGASATPTVPTVTVTNTRTEVEPASARVKAQKILKGAQLEEGEFEFSLTGNGVNAIAVNDANGIVEFAPINFDFARALFIGDIGDFISDGSGTNVPGVNLPANTNFAGVITLNKADFANTNTKDYFFTLKEVPAERNDIVFDTTEYTVKITVTVDDTLSKLTASAPEIVTVDQNGNPLTFTNEKKGTAVVKKIVTQIIDGEEVEFPTNTKFDISVNIAYPDGNTDTQNIQLGANEKKEFNFLPIGTVVTVNETGAKGFTASYSPATKSDTVKLNEADNTVVNADVTVKNSRPAPIDTEATLSVTKTLKGDTLTDDQFRFVVKGAGFGDAGEAVTNKGAVATFPKITYKYTEGTEQNDNVNHIVYLRPDDFDATGKAQLPYSIVEDTEYRHDANMLYDSKTITATVTVTKTGSDQITLTAAAPSYTENGTFVNTKMADFSVKKVVKRTDDTGAIVEIKETDADYQHLANQEFKVKFFVTLPGQQEFSMRYATIRNGKDAEPMTEIEAGVYGFTIKHNETVSIPALPVGTKVRFEEVADSNYKVDSQTLTLVKDSAANVATLTNILQAEGKGYASVNKAFTPNAIKAGLSESNANTYNFNLAYSGNVAGYSYNENVSINGANGWSANFPAISFPADLDYANGIDFTFLMKETAATTTDSNIVVDTDTFTLTYNVKQGADGLAVTGPSIKKNGTDDATSATFYNGYRLGDVAVEKALEDYDGSAMTADNLTFPVTATATYANGETESFNGEIGFKEGRKQSFTISDLPRGTKVTVQETDSKGMTVKSIAPAEITIGETAQVITVTNKRTTLVDVPLTIGAFKALEGSSIDSNTPFDFTLTGEYKGQQISLTAKNSNSNITFAPITFTLDESKKGAENTIYLAKSDFTDDKATMQFTVKEVKDDRENISFDLKERTVNVEVTRTETYNTVSLTAGVTDAQAPTFINTKLGKVGFNKTAIDIDGKNYTPNVDFIFEVSYNKGNEEVKKDVTINIGDDKTDNDSFISEYLPVGTVVTVTEKDAKGFIPNTASKTLTVADQTAPVTFTFVNTHPEATGTQIVPTAVKYLEGASLKEGEFEFKLTGNLFGTEIEQTKTNDKNGMITFDPIKFSLEKDEEGAIKLTKDMFADTDELPYTLTITEVVADRLDIEYPAQLSQTFEGSIIYTNEGSEARIDALMLEEAHEFTNVQLGRVGFTKTAVDINGEEFKPDTTFTFKAEYKDGNQWKVLADDIKINLGDSDTTNDTYVTRYLPVGTEVRFTETDTAGFENSVTEQTVVVALEDNSANVPFATVNFTNRRPVPGVTRATLTAEKVLNGAALADGDFSFIINGEGASANKEYKNTGKNITFDEIVYKYSKTESETTSGNTVVLHDSDFTNGKAVREYTITEKNTALPDVIYAANTVKGVVTITKTETASTITLKADVTYPDGKTFLNEIRKGSVKVVKKNQSDENVDGVTFKLYKVTSNDLSRDEVLTKGTFVDDKKTENGVAEFKDLDLYVDEYQSINNPTYQWYCLAETDPGKDYNLNSGLSFFKVPTEGVYDLTFEYVNGKVITPTSGGSGMKAFTFAGCGIIGFGALAFAAYMLFVRRSNKKRAHYRAK